MLTHYVFNLRLVSPRGKKLTPPPQITFLDHHSKWTVVHQWYQKVKTGDRLLKLSVKQTSKCGLEVWNVMLFTYPEALSRSWCWRCRRWRTPLLGAERPDSWPWHSHIGVPQSVCSQIALRRPPSPPTAGAWGRLDLPIKPLRHSL